MEKVRGFTLIEILVALTLSAVLVMGIANLFSINRRVAIDETADSTLEGNMRLAMTDITRTLRHNGYGVPGADMDTWVSWVTGFTATPMIVQGATASDPDTISVAHCALVTVTEFSADAAADDTTFSVTSATGIDAANNRLLMLDSEETVQVVSVTGTTIGIDTDVVLAGQQGLSRDYPAGTPICRVGVKTYSVDLTTSTLQVDFNDGAGPQVLAGEITDMQVVAVGGDSFAVTFSGQSGTLSPTTGTYASRSRSATISPRN